ncbi:hypothetical protein, partial [Streptacidiphilus monticola]
MRTDAKIAAAVAGGYLLGRKRNAKLALGLGLWLTGRRISLDPAHLTRQLAGLPLVGTVRDQIGGELGAVGRKVLTTAVSNRADSWAESLGRRTASLRGTGAGQKSDQDSKADASRADEEPADASA